jgi:predicted enzyme related to lactoylglutathione lyase
MSNVARFALGTFAALAVAFGAEAAVTLNSARIGGPDVEALGKFYAAAFGLKEVNRLNAPSGPELFFNFGDSVDAAKANTAAQIVIMHADANANANDSVPHLIFNVTDAAATADAVKKAGGKMASDPKPFGNTGIVIGIAVDPAGNRIELIQRPQR